MNIESLDFTEVPPQEYFEMIWEQYPEFRHDIHIHVADAWHRRLFAKHFLEILKIQKEK
jgi:hypothetical protein